jgi:hypothetical protein
MQPKPNESLSVHQKLAAVEDEARAAQSEQKELIGNLLGISGEISWENWKILVAYLMGFLCFGLSPQTQRVPKRTPKTGCRRR